LKTPFRRRRSIYTHFYGAGEVLIYTYLAPKRPEKPEKYLYTPGMRGTSLSVRHNGIIAFQEDMMSTSLFRRI